MAEQHVEVEQAVVEQQVEYAQPQVGFGFQPQFAQPVLGTQVDFSQPLLNLQYGQPALQAPAFGGVGFPNGFAFTFTPEEPAAATGSPTLFYGESESTLRTRDATVTKKKRDEGICAKIAACFNK